MKHLCSWLWNCAMWIKVLGTQATLSLDCGGGYCNLFRIIAERKCQALLSFLTKNIIRKKKSWFSTTYFQVLNWFLTHFSGISLILNWSLIYINMSLISEIPDVKYYLTKLDVTLPAYFSVWLKLCHSCGLQ